MTTKKTTKLRSIESAMERRAEAVASTPTSDDPVVELGHLARSHAAQTTMYKALKQQAAPSVKWQDGTVVQSRLPEDTRATLDEVQKVVKLQAKRMQTRMLRQLRKVPVYAQFMQHVYGLGPVTAAYLVAFVDMKGAGKGLSLVKPSQIQAFCGVACNRETGRLARREKGVKRQWHPAIRTALFSMVSAMVRNAIKDGVTSKYVDIFVDTIRSVETSPRLVGAGKDAKIALVHPAADGSAILVPARLYARKKAWLRTASIFVEDLYVVWRAIEGLPVVCSYANRQRSRSHGTDPRTDAPLVMTVEEALSSVTATWPREIGKDVAKARQQYAPAEEDDVDGEDAVNAAAE